MAVSSSRILHLDDLLAPWFQHHSPAVGQTRTVNGLKQWWTSLRTQFPDLQMTINDVITEGDRVAVRGTFYCGGGSFGRFLEVLKIQDERITDLWNVITFDRGWVEYGAGMR